MVDLESILKVAVQGGASDIHLKAGLPPLFRINGGLVPLRNGPRLTGEILHALFTRIAERQHVDQLSRDREIDFAYTAEALGRFRVNAFYQRQTLALVMRVIPSEVKSISELDLPPILERIALEPRGLVLVTGATGSGKSTTLAAMVDLINETRADHILTIEDPIEFLFRDRRSIINQREVGLDTRTFASALRAALRQDPDVIFVGEMRDEETIETAMTAAETGHLVLSTLHTVDAVETINRIIGIFPPHQHKQIRVALAASIRAIISQRLLRRADGRGRVAAMEVLLATHRVRELLQEEGRLLELRETIAQGNSSYGMQTFDQSLMMLLRRGLITRDEALANCTNKDDFLLRLSGVQGTSDTQWEGFE
ncbi:MAG: type IV pilus twitching motility protein PilT [Myxococcales bacterium]|nr:type IV pilus twitching motility protein PilT [Myxococcales bacterium]